jgi:hypothetical protein
MSSIIEMKHHGCNSGHIEAISVTDTPQLTIIYVRKRDYSYIEWHEEMKLARFTESMRNPTALSATI